MANEKIDKILLEKDRKYVWHPYSPAKSKNPIYLVKSAKDVFIKLSTGKKLIDGISSWWCVSHGYRNPHILKAIKKQLKKMPHIMFAGLTHKPAIELAEKISSLFPEDMNKVFCVDSGSVAVEVAMKMAIQYWYGQGIKEKNRIMTVKGGYHGDTWHSMSVCDPDSGMHTMYNGILPTHIFIDKPKSGFNREWSDTEFLELEKKFIENSSKCAAFILEPIVQGAGGMNIYSPQFLQKIREFCDKYNILLICDEIATGFYRTGKRFASDYADITGDIVCLGKGLTGGNISFAAVIVKDKVANMIDAGIPGVLMHGPTFQGSPLASAISLDSIRIYEKFNYANKVAQIEKILKDLLLPISLNKKVFDVRILGAIGVVELFDNVDLKKITPMFIEHNIWVRPFGKIAYIMPPLIIKPKELTILCNNFIKVIEKYLDEK